MKNKTYVRQISKSILLCYVIAYSAPFSCHPVFAFQIVQRRGAKWVGLTPGQTFRLARYELTEEVNASTLIRKDYIKRKTDKRPVPFYTHNRAIVVTLGNRGSLVLINDNEASKSNKVVVVNLDTNKTNQVDIAAIEMYRRNASPDAA